MTSRVRRIVLAMYGHSPSHGGVAIVRAGEIVGFTDTMPRVSYGCCYEAMDEPDETLVVTRGNFGLPCA